jgi:hypothetical protein
VIETRVGKGDSSEIIKGQNDVSSSLINLLGKEIDANTTLENQKALLVSEKRSLACGYERAQNTIRTANEFIRIVQETLEGFREFPLLAPLVRFVDVSLSCIRTYNVGELVN